MIYSLRGGGAEKMAVILANQFVKSGNIVNLYLFYNKDFAYDINSKVILRNCEVEEKNKLSKTIQRVKRLRQSFKSDQNDILLAFTISMVPFALLAARGLKCKIIGCERANPFAHRTIYKFAIRYLSPFCNGFIFQTKGAQSYYPKRVQRHSVILQNIAANDARQCNWDDMTKLCSVGRLHQDKDFPTLLKAFALLNKEKVDTTLTIFGDGPQRDSLINLTQMLGIGEKVFFRGFVKNLKEELARYSIFVFSSKAEGMPNALLDAMSVGLGCISTDCSFGPSELICNGINGWLVPVGDEKAMAERMLWMLQHPSEAQEMGNKAREIQKTNSEDRISKKFLSYFKERLEAN